MIVRTVFRAAKGLIVIWSFMRTERRGMGNWPGNRLQFQNVRSPKHSAFTSVLPDGRGSSIASANARSERLRLRLHRLFIKQNTKNFYTFFHTPQPSRATPISRLFFTSVTGNFCTQFLSDRRYLVFTIEVGKTSLEFEDNLLKLIVFIL